MDNPQPNKHLLPPGFQPEAGRFAQVEPKPLPISSEMVGIDLGLTTFATISNGETIERQRWMKRDEKDLKRIQRKVSALAKGSPERRRAIKALNHVHTRVKNRRDNFAHQESRKLVNHYGLIVFIANP